MTEERKLAGSAVLRRARPGDEDGILECIRALAAYEKEPDAVETTAAGLRETLFSGAPSVFAHVVEKPSVEKQSVEKQGVEKHSAGRDPRIVGIAVWFLNYSTWTGRNGIYLEDLFVRESERGNGYGKALLTELAKLCAERGYRRFEWSVLDWNEPSIAFYRSIGAVGMDGWTVQRLDGEALERLAAG